MKIITVAADELEALIKRACAEAVIEASRRVASAVERVSAADAARMVRCRRAVVLHSCADGTLPAERKGRGWRIRVADLDAWARSR
jgi:excisionase family DNA binding protein